MLLLSSLLVVLFLDRLSAQYRTNQGFSNHIPNQTINPALKDWFSEVTDENVYQKWKKPTRDGPTIVNVSIHLYTNVFLDEVTTEFSAQLLLRTVWADERLICDKPYADEIIEGNEFYLARVWAPMLHIPNNHEAYPITETQNNLFKINPKTGIVLTSKRIKIRVFCSMYLINYPFDYQNCLITFESSALPFKRLILKWADRPVFITEHFKLFGYDLVNISTEEGYSTFPETGIFSNVNVKFVIKRKFGQFLLDTYVPSVLFVITSWVGFWIAIPAAPARVTLAMTTLLTLVTSAKSSREKIPKMSYITALDIWILTCTCFVFATLIEYAYVNHVYWKDKRCKKRRALKKCASSTSFMSLIPDDNLKRSSSLMPEIKLDSNPFTKEHSKTIGNFFELKSLKGQHTKPVFTITDDCDTQQNTLQNPQSQMSRSTSLQIENCNSLFTCDSLFCSQDIANSIDRRCRIVFPVFFLAFNTIYWSVLLCVNWSSNLSV